MLRSKNCFYRRRKKVTVDACGVSYRTVKRICAEADMTAAAEVLNNIPVFKSHKKKNQQQNLLQTWMILTKALHAKLSKNFMTEERSTGFQFLIDSGAAVSCFLRRLTNHRVAPDNTLYAANGSAIKCYSGKTLNLDLGLRRKFSWSFIVADISHPIIGSDFLERFELLVDIKNCHLIDSLAFLSAKGVKAPSFQASPGDVSPLPGRVKALTEYPLTKSVEELCRFLALINLYHRLLKNAAGKQACLHDLVKERIKRNKTPIIWTDETKEAFQACKELLKNAAMLAYPTHNTPLSLVTDASETVIGDSIATTC
ncbi:hypothetical protein AVEN_218001-1 [Araneus ventricosus]|uniref:Reverse transcriptase/retrotransposon-derived protein RNase H-like domain-containing protein n=1 Tax=Araneus ventricosus TaxID=182803 RepID=A0A4Y2KHW7_ARAVE|nr:hypothetical protein AVEN_218001-1 [Araneus ventricosus]